MLNVIAPALLRVIKAAASERTVVYVVPVCVLIEFVRIGAVSVLLVSVSVDEVVTIFTPSIAATPADTLEIVVSEACPSSIDPRPNAVEVEEVIPLTGRPVAFVR
jgi:hypothetical protein